MPKYTVLFEGPRIYNAGHAKGERRAWGLNVFAESPEAARRHALTVTAGRARVSSVVDGFVSVEPPPEEPTATAPHVEDVPAQERAPL